MRAPELHVWIFICALTEVNTVDNVHFEYWTSFLISKTGGIVVSVVPKCVQWTIVHEFIHILGKRELNVLYSAWWMLLWTWSFTALSATSEQT